jgi:hypothetical protein
MSWLNTPLPVVAAYARMLPRLEAEGSMRRATEIGAGTGSLSRGDARQLWSDWSRGARIDRPTRAPRVGSAAEFERTAAALGVELVKVKPVG